MAESYRGLTIRIGGDTTKLSNALKAANQAISGTQSSLKKLSDALKMDPTSIKAAQLQVGAFAAQATNASTRLVELNRAMKQIGDDIPEGATQTIRQMAAEMDNVQMEAALAQERYNGLTAALATAYTKLSDLSAESAKLAGQEMGEKLVGSDISMDFEAIKSGIEMLSNAYGDSDGKLKELLADVTSLQKEHADLAEKAAAYKQVMESGDESAFVGASMHLQETSTKIDEVRSKLAGVVEEISKFEGKATIFKFDNDNVDLQSLAQGLQALVAQQRLSVEAADEQMYAFIHMKEEWQKSFGEIQNINKLAGFSDLEAEAAKAEAKVAAVVKQLVEATKVNATQGITKLEEQLQSVANAGSDAASRLKEALGVLESSFAGGKGEITEAQMMDSMRAYADAVEAANMQVDLLEQEIAKLSENEAVANLASSTRALVAESQQAEQAFSEASDTVARYEAQLVEIRKEQADIVEKNAGYAEDARYQELAQQATELNTALKGARESAAEAKKTFVEMSQAVTLREKEHELEQTKNTLLELARINVKPEIDVSALDGLQKALDAISKGTFDPQGFGKFAADLKIATASLDEAKARYEALKKAAEGDPLNANAAVSASRALEQAIARTQEKIVVLQKSIEDIPSNRIDKMALEAGRAEEAYTKWKLRVDELDESIRATEKSISLLTKNRDEIKIVDSKSYLQFLEISRRINNLKTQLSELQSEADGALDELAKEENTRRILEVRTEIAQLTTDLHTLREGAEASGKTDATPKIDQAAFMQAVNQISQEFRRMGSEIVQSSNEIDSAFRDMTKTVNGTEEELEALRESAIRYSQTSFTSADTMLEMQALGGQLGVLTKDLAQFGKITSNLDIATDIDAEDVALKLGQISNVLQLDIDGMQGFSDALVRLGNNMPAQESAIMAVAQRFGAVAATANFSADEVLAWSASIAATGQRSEAAATAISNTVSGIEQAVAKGGDSLQQFAAIAHMSSDEFVKSWQTSPTQTLRAFIDGLRMLKESDESAVAALEEMGITGVRQQQTLLALTQTIGNLDDALQMSSDAFNGINDQWGQAGDAANEAEKKSKGFSGALQMLKNNAQNLGAVLGDSLVPAMRTASDFLAVLTNLLNSLPAPVKSAIVTFGGLTIALSAIVPLVSTFHNGWLAMLTAFGTSASSVGTVATSVAGLSAAAEGAATSTGFLATIMGGPLAIAAAAGVAAFGLVYTSLKKQEEAAQLAYDATVRLENAMSASSGPTEEYSDKVENAAEKLFLLRDASKAVTEDNANLAGELEEAWSGINDAESDADDYIAKIEELAEKSSRTKEEQGELVAAVSAYNDITGSSISVLDAEAGQLSVTTDELKKHNDAWKRSTEAEQAIKQYPEIVKHLKEAKDALADLREQQQNMVYGETIADEVEQAEANVASLESLMEQTKGKLSDVGVGVAQLVTELEAAGVSTDQFSSLSERDWAKVAAAYKGNISEAISMLRQLASEQNGVADMMSGLNTSSGLKTTDPIYKSYKKTFDNQYNELKAGLNSQYTAAKRSYDAQYKAAKDSYDAQYKAAQKHFDQQYKAAQKAYDKQYKELQKTLDNEYNERKKAYDKQLQALKDSQDAEVDAFNKATDEKLKAMEREYNQRVKLLEAEYGFKTDDIDERIKALEDQNKAEKQAIEDRKDEEKRAELQAAVDNANSRRRRAEAEKALNDFVEELQQKRNEDARKAEIERLKDEKTAMKEELDARKAALKEQYDAEVEQYKTSRNEQLEALKAANQAEYDAMKENLDNQLVALKEQQTERLEALKESQTEQLEAMKENQTAQLEAMKANQQAALENMKSNQQAELDSIKASNDAQLQALKDANDAKLEALRKGGEDALRAYEFQSANMISKANMLKEGMIKTADTMFDNITKAFGLGRRDATNATKETVSDVDTTYGKMPTLVENTTKIATNAIASAFLGGRTDVKSASDEVVASAMDGPSKLPGTMGETGEESTGNYVTGLSKGGASAANVTRAIAEAALYSLDSKTSFAYSSGFNLANNFASGVQAAANIMYTAVGNMANIAYSYFHHSTPDEGPLKHDDEWGGEMIQNLIDGMRDKESDLYRQVKKMSDIVEDGFDPTMSVDAAYEALDTIGNKRSKAMSDVFNVGASAPEIKIEMNLNLSDVTIREDADIERLAEVLSQKMAAQASRQLAGRLG